MKGRASWSAVRQGVTRLTEGDGVSGGAEHIQPKTSVNQAGASCR